MSDTESKQKPKLLWGAEAIGEELNRSARQAFYLLTSGRIKCARKVGALYCAPQDRLRAEFGLDDVERHEVA
jgi:hypothetical protein